MKDSPMMLWLDQHVINEQSTNNDDGKQHHMRELYMYVQALHIDTYIHRQTDRQTDIHTYIQTDIQTINNSRSAWSQQLITDVFSLLNKRKSDFFSCLITQQKVKMYHSNESQQTIQLHSMISCEMTLNTVTVDLRHFSWPQFTEISQPTSQSSKRF